MKKIGLLSDTHGMLSNRIINFFDNVDEIWHAGDIGTPELADKLSALKPMKAVFGNIDGHILRKMYPEILKFTEEEVSVVMVHIGGYPGRYEPKVQKILKEQTPKLFISGHSHILKIIYDKKLNLLHINPGAAGNKGYHKVCTAIRFIIDKGEIKELEILEFERIKFNEI